MKNFLYILFELLFSSIDKQLIMIKLFCLLKRLWFYLVFKILDYLIKYSKWRNQNFALKMLKCQ